MSENANAVRLGVLTLVIYIAALTSGLRLFYYLAYVLGAVLVAAFLWSQLNRRGLQVKREVSPTQAQVGQVVRETIELTNLSVLRKLWVEVRDQSTLPGHHVGAVVSMGGRKQKRWQVRTRCVRRGLYRMGPTIVITGDPFGLFQVSRVLEGRGDVLVFPPSVPLTQFGIPSGELPGGNRTERRTFHSTPSAVGLREYLPGDPVHRIHWPASARAQKLMVKEFELDPTADLWLVLDLNEAVQASVEEAEDDTAATAQQSAARVRWARPGAAEPHADARPDSNPIPIDPSTEEYGITIASSLATFFIAEGRSVGLIAWGQHKVTIPADRGGRQLIKILRALAVLRAEGTTSLAEVITAESFQFGKQDTVVAITPQMDDAWVNTLRSQMMRMASAVAILLEPATFGGEGNALMLIGALTAINVPSYIVKRDDAIDLALSQEFLPSNRRNLS